jgi:autotransporter translocation and assembly factor TamB
MLQRRVAPAKRHLRRTLQIVAFAGTLLIGIIALALIASQTPWFRGWLRGYVERQAKQYVNGTLSIGSLGGNLFYGIELGDISIDVNGEHILTLKRVEVKYSIAELVSKGATIREIRLDQPFIVARRDATGWNLARLVKRQEQEANRQGPTKPISLPDIEIVDGRVAIDDRTPSSAYRLPSRIDQLNVKAGFEYEPVHYSLTLDRFAFAGKAPDLTVQNLAGRIGVRDDDMNVEKLFLQTPQSSVTIDGVIHNYLATPSLEVTVSAPKLSLPEFSGVLPPVEGYNLHPSFDVKANGLLERLQMALNVKSEAGTASGTVTADLRTPDLGVRGDLSVQDLDLAPILKSPAQKSDITGHAKLDIKVATQAAPAPAIDRLRGRVVFEGPKVVAAGYTASNVRVTADLAGRRIGLDGRANAYGGSATAKGFIVVPGPAGQPTQIDLAGSASHINLSDLPRTINAPRIATDLNATAYHVKGAIGRTTTVEGSATMAQSTIAGGTILDGTTGEFSLSSGPAAARSRSVGSGEAAPSRLQSLTYAARGEVRDLNLRKVGDAFQIVALAKPEYDSRINTTFDMKGTGVTAAETRVDASGTATSSELFGATVPHVTYDVHVANGPTGVESLTYTARGEVRGLDLQRIGSTFQIAALAKSEYASRINTQFDVKGSGTTIDDMQLDATGAATDSQVFGGTLPRMAYDAHLSNGGLKGRANGEFKDFDPARLAANPQYKGRVSGTVDATFGVANLSAPITPDAISADGRVTLTPSEIAGLKIDAADIQGQYANRRGDLRQATIKGPDFDVQASGPIALDRTGQSNVKYHVAATDLENIGKVVNQPIAGGAVLDGTVTGNAASLETTGTLDGSNLGYQNNKALDLNSKYKVTVPDLTFARAEVQATTSGTFVQIGSIQISMLTATTTYANQKLDFDTHLAQTPSGGQAEKAAGGIASGARELDATGSVIFHPDHRELHLPKLAVRTQGVEWKTAAGNVPTVKYGNNQIQLQDVKLVNADQALDISGTFSLGDNPQIGGIDVHAKNVDISQLEKLALQNRGFSGRLDADAKISGSAKAPVVTGHVAVADGGFQQFKYQSLTADASYTNGRVALDARLVQTPGAELTAKGTLPMSALRPNPPGVSGHTEPAPGEAIDLRIQSTRVDLGIIQGFTKELTNVTGTMQADVHVTGSGTDPHVNGYVDLQNGGFGVVQAGVVFRGMTTRIEMADDRIRVPRFQVLDQHGSPLTIQGELAVHERSVGAVNIALDSDDFKVIDNELGNVHLESHLKLTGEVRHPRLVGELRTDAARIEIDKVLLMFANPYSEEALPDVISAQETTTSAKGADEATRDALARGREIGAANASRQNATAPETPAPQTGIFSALSLDIHVVAPDNLVLRGSDLRPGGPTAAQVGAVNATVGADLQAEKRENGPVTLRGTANTVRGFYEFQGRRFTIQRDGTVQFHGLPELNPDIDVTAERLIPNTGVTVRIHITGTARAPQLTLTSDPPLDEADILSLIVFNRSVNELGTGERASLAETAGGIASGFVASSLGRSIGKALDIDLFEITTSDDVTGEIAGGVTLGKQVSDKAFVRFRQQFGQRSFSEFMMEYQLAKFLRVETRLSPETSGVANRLTQRRVERGGLDLIFFFSY